MKFLKIAVLAALAMNFSAPSYALDRLSESTVQKFYDEAADAQRKGKDKALKFMQAHFSEDANVTINTIIKIEGASETQEEVKSFTKPEMLEITAQNFDIADVQKYESKIMSMEISEDKQSAVVKMTSYTVASMMSPTPQGEVQITSETTMFCTDNIGYGKKGEIEITKSDCTAEAKIAPIQ